MSKMKHLLRKLHIGDHHHQGRTSPAALDPSQSLLSSSSSTSPSSDLLPSSDLPRTTPSSENESSNNNFNFFEEEFQMQLALAISVSDPGQNLVDSETVQIDAAKQISLGCCPSQSLPEFSSLRYSTYNVLNYDEKIIDGFYDICGIDSNLSVQAKMPSLVDLEAISVLDDVGYEVILVNRSVDVELRKLEERVHIMSKEYRALDRGLNTNILAQKLANLIVERMGGPVADVEEMFWRWRSRNHELRVYLNTVMLPLGSLDVGHSRQRALLFKVLADRINLPCKLVKGSYYTGTDEGAINLIKLDSGSEYIIDLMGAPGTLIPAEIPSGHHESFGLDARSIANFVGIDKSSSTYDLAARMRSSPLCVDEATKPTSSSTESYSVTFEPNRKGRRIAGKIQNEQLMYDANAAIRPVSENSALAVEDLLSGVSSHDLREDNVLERNALFGRESAVDQRNLEIYMCNSEEFLATSSGVPLNHIPFTSNRKRSAEGLRENQFKLDIPGYKLPVSSSTRRDLVEFGNKDVNPIDDTVFGREQVGFSGNEEAMEIACSSQFNTNKSHNMQIDHAINGVAEILWDELQIGERIGIGSYGEVYRGEWNGTEVAVKKFMKQDISGTALTQFKCEIEIMMRLRHPNVVLFMGAVMRPPNMSILTEFLPRGSLYKLLHRPNIQVDEKKRIKMALDVVKGMNYLHTSSPIIVHRDLKTPNLLVDKNWVVKVCDFGMSRLQHNTFLSSKSAAGTAEWMAPEVLRNEPSNEKSDIYSFGVILWELATMQVPWTEMNSMQVVGAVGWQGRHLDIPDSVDPMVAEIISDCWNRNPQARPSFAEIITRLKGLQGLSVQRSENH